MRHKDIGHQDTETRTQTEAVRSDLEASLPLLDVLLRVEDDDVDFGQVEHPERDEGAERHGHSQGGRLDEHLQREELVTTQSFSSKHLDLLLQEAPQ